MGEGNVTELCVTITVRLMLATLAPNSAIWNIPIHLTSLTVTSPESEVNVQKKYAVYAGQMGIVLDTRAETRVGLSLTALQLHSYRSVCFEVQIKVRNFLTER